MVDYFSWPVREHERSAAAACSSTNRRQRFVSVELGAR